MKKRLRFSPLLLAASTLLAAWPHPPLCAHPSTSPSAQMAARLKYRPPNNWIRHYLGDDRYKVAGRVWKVVSTQLDTYYHRPNCPNMLRQSANIVIGFPNFAEAEEGGYVPDPLCSPQSASVIYMGAGQSTSGSSGETINRTRRAMRIVLADGKSTVMLPPNWRRTQTGSQTILGHSLLSDTLQPLQGKGFLRFAFVNVPAGINAEPLLTAEKFPALAQAANRSGQASTAAQNFLNNTSVTNTKLGGRGGVLLSPKTPGAGASGRLTVAARGSKVYLLENNAGTNAGASTVINSFQPR